MDSPNLNRATPFDNLATELVELIFWHCVYSTTVIACPHPGKAPLLLCEVCSHWRTIAISSPSLWTSLSVRCGRSTSKPSLPLIRTWLDRSMESPLSIHILVNTWDLAPIRNVALVKDILSLVIAESRRWQDVEIILPNFNYSPLRTTLQDATPHLRRLSIQAESNVSSGISPPPILISILQQSPNLRSLILKMPATGNVFASDSIDRSRLIELHLGCSLTISDCMFMMNQSPMLRYCYFEGVCSGVDRHYDPNLPRSFTLLHLLTLRIEGTVSFTRFFRSLTLPALRSLTIEATGTQSDHLHWNSCELHDLFRRSNCPLQTLTLDNYQPPEDELIDCLTSNPSLECLEVNDEGEGRLTDKVLLALGTRSGDSGCYICPKLTTIKFTGTVRSSDGSVCDMVRQRWRDEASANGVAALKVVHVEFGGMGNRHERDFDVLKELRSQGLTARVFMRASRFL
ncbi:hypothetical protein B0H34DRAFT_104305 [Crassisporium funariophilum]|nr:hypothetical protein B0H34DRAFT_104305 [Crassisporium funariophilum]